MPPVGPAEKLECQKPVISSATDGLRQMISQVIQQGLYRRRARASERTDQAKITVERDAQRQSANAGGVGRYHRCRHQRNADAFAHQRQCSAPVADGHTYVSQRNTGLLCQPLRVEAAAAGSQHKGQPGQRFKIHRLPALASGWPLAVTASHRSCPRG